MPEPDLTFIANQLERVLIDNRQTRADMRQTRDDMRVLIAMMQRLDHSVIDVLNELHAIHQWMIGISQRISDQA